MKNYSKFLLAGFFCTVAFGAGACSNADVGGTASTDEVKKVALVWEDARLFDVKSELPDCKKFDGVAQVIDEKSFFKCVDGKWELLDVSAPAYEQLPKCDATMNDFCIDIVNDNKVDASYVCNEGKWVKGTRIEGFEGCFKGDENGGLEDYMAWCIKCFMNPSLQDCINGTGPLLEQIQEQMQEQIQEQIQERIQELIQEQMQEQIQEQIQERIQERIQELIQEQTQEQLNMQIKCSINWDVGMEMVGSLMVPLGMHGRGVLVVKQFFSPFIDDGCCSISSYMDKPHYSDVCE